MKAFPNLYRESLVHRNVIRTRPETIIDLGCGKGVLMRSFHELGWSIDKSYLVGLDLFHAYLRTSKAQYDDVVLCDIRMLPLRSKCCDLALLIDVIEHLEKSDGIDLLDGLESACKETILVATHVGFSEKSELEDNNSLQAHRSGWSPAEFESRGYVVHGFGGFRFLRDGRGRVTGTSRLDHMIRRFLSVVTQVFTHGRVGSAYEMLCIKTNVPEHRCTQRPTCMKFLHAADTYELKG